MCGIVGIVNRNRTVIDPAILTRMGDTLKHRGPDDEGDFIDGCVGLHHKRLAIIDLVSGHQPMSSGHLTLVFNGEIYNYIELREALKQKGHQFQTNSDTEVILKMYAEYGTDAIKQLNGMFAFLLYDREQNRLIAARDHFGIKPLYYYASNEYFLFASEIKALLQHPAVPAEADYEAMQEYVTFQYIIGDSTLFKGIHKLLPAHYQVIDLELMRVRTVRYWESCFVVDVHHTEEYFIYTLRTLLEDAIQLQLRSDVPVGTYLSGGIDSSIVTMLASKFYSKRLKTFTGAFFEGPEFDESSYAREVAAACDAEMFLIYPTDIEFIETLPRLIYHMDEPVAGPGLFPQYMVSRLAAREVTVVLGGQGGDEIFAGYTRYVVAYLEQVLKGAIFETNEEGEHIVSMSSILPNLPILQQYVPMLKHFWEHGTFEEMDRRYFSLVERIDGRSSLLSQDFLATYDREKIFRHFQQIFNHPDTLSYFNKMVNFDMVASLPALLQVEDRVSMAVSLESRVPLLDYRIVDLVTSMPPRMKFKGAETKHILKKTMKDLLPEKIMTRKDKMGFPVPLHLWAKNRAGDFLRDILLSSSCRNRGIFDERQIQRSIENDEPFSRRLWGILNLELWHQQFIDQPANAQNL
ncbi:asparagine synthase (Glutamine-hydrolyzing) [Candidatus Moduliflexus flocculans]|uniref:asparagine synthase (glutamine-hydrolyzing) n=1 Tax=Candidatus Moduliflexus flocculans TaxID=1499966 RepID=A0A0S6VZV4_9BACT|nr:asparagine synthase (Glutamine-hydrolyzing) [Candidatus Moduliflexus flocculans]